MKRKTDTKRLLLDTTRELLREDSSFTVKDICERAFTNIAAVNYHFGDKEALVREAVTEIMDELKATLLPLFAAADSKRPEETIALVLSALLDFYAGNRGAVKYILLDSGGVEAQGLVTRVLYDEQFTGGLFSRLSAMTGETDERILFYKYSIAVSAFLMPLFLEGSARGDYLSLSELQRPENRDAFIAQILRLFS